MTKLPRQAFTAEFCKPAVKLASEENPLCQRRQVASDIGADIGKQLYKAHEAITESRRSATVNGAPRPSKGQGMGLVVVGAGWGDDESAGGRLKKTDAHPKDRGKREAKRRPLTGGAGPPFE
jgi:hypothetical protein